MKITLPLVLVSILVLVSVRLFAAEPEKVQAFPVVNSVGKIDLLSKRFAHSSILQGRYLYLLGGWDGFDHFTQVERIDLTKAVPKAENWLPEKSVRPRIYGTAACDGKSLYLFGGYQELKFSVDENGKPKSKVLTVYLPLVDSIDLATGEVKTIEARLPRPRWLAEAHYQDGKFYIIGGGQGGVCRCCKQKRCSAVDIFNPDSGKFRPGTRMPTPRETNSASLPDGRIVAFGGFDGRQSRREVEIYSPKLWKWEARKKMPIVASTGGTCYWKGHIITIGDFVNESLISVYDIEKDQWHYGQGSGKIPNQSTAHIHGDRIFVVGGKFRDRTVVDSITIYHAADLVAKIKGN